MKKQTIILIVVLILIALVLLGVGTYLKGKDNTVSSSKLSSVSDMKKMFNTINGNLKNELPELETEEIDASDAMAVESYTGLKSNENVEKIVVSEPLMSSQAYSAVAVKVKAGADIESMKQEMLNNIDTNKWICVSAGAVYITNCENTIFLVMSDEDWAKPVYNEFKKYVENDIGKELEKISEEDIQLPDEMYVVE